MIDLFTAEEVKRAKEILAEPARIHDEIVTEGVMQRIDRHTGQANDRKYMAYRLEHIARSTP